MSGVSGVSGVTPMNATVLTDVAVVPHVRWAERGVSTAWQRVAPHAHNLVSKHDDYTVDDLRRLVTAGGASLVLIEDTPPALPTLLGFGIVQLRTFAGRTYLHDAHVWVLPAHRGCGAYDAYLNFLTSEARARALDGVTLSVHADEDARWRPTLSKRGYRPRAVEYVKEL